MLATCISIYLLESSLQRAGSRKFPQWSGWCPARKYLFWYVHHFHSFLCLCLLTVSIIPFPFHFLWVFFLFPSLLFLSLPSPVSLPLDCFLALTVHILPLSCSFPHFHFFLQVFSSSSAFSCSYSTSCLFWSLANIFLLVLYLNPL